ncbi:MAG: hypothetical protein ACK6DY_13280, partial [Acidobacteriota bacterium]
LRQAIRQHLQTELLFALQAPTSGFVGFQSSPTLYWRSRHGESFVKRTCAKHRSPRLAFPLWLALSSRRSGLVTEDWPFKKRAAWWRTARRRAAGQNPDD